MTDKLEKSVTQYIIWNESSLREFAGHSDPMVRRWALSRLNILLDDIWRLALAVEFLRDEDGALADYAFEMMMTCDISDNDLPTVIEGVRTYASRSR